MLARLFRPKPLAALIAVGGLLALLVLFLATGYAQTPPPPPDAPAQPLGNPANLTAAPGDSPGSVALHWDPAANAAAHFIYLVKSAAADGRYWNPLPGDAASETVTGLAMGQSYQFAVIAGRPGPEEDASAWQWSQWSNWAQSASASPPPPPPPPDDTATPTPGTATPTPTTTTPTPEPGHRGRIHDAEVEGWILSLDPTARTLAVRYTEYEHFGGVRPPNPLTVDYARLPHIGDCLRPGQHIEAEGVYDLADSILYAYELELESRNDCGYYDDDHDDDDDYDDDHDDDYDDDD